MERATAHNLAPLQVHKVYEARSETSMRTGTKIPAQVVGVLLREVSWRHVRHAPLRPLLVVFGIALGVSMWCAVLATQRSLTASFEEMVEGVAGKSDLTLSNGTAGVPASLLGEIANVHGVAHAAAALEVVTQIAGANGTPLLVLGLDFLGDPYFTSWIEGGGARAIEDPLAFVNDPTAILVTSTLAKERGLARGDALELMTADGDKTFHVRGIIEPSGPSAAFAGQVVLMFLDAAQLSFGRGEVVDRIDLALSADHSAEEVTARLRAQLRGRAEIDPPAGRTQRLAASLEIFRTGLDMSALVAVLVGMFLIYNAVSVSVAQRRHEIGVLRSIGATRRALVSLFCAEALLMALIGIALGLLLAAQLAHFAVASIESTISEVVLAVRPPAPVISPRIAGAGALVGLLSTLIAAYLPALRASRVEPAEAVRSTRASALLSAPPVRALALAGAAAGLGSLLLARRGGALDGPLAVAGLVIATSLLTPICMIALKRLLTGSVERVLGVPGRLALDNVERALGRSAITVAALMLAVAMSISIAAYATSFERSVMQWADDAFALDATITQGAPLASRHSLAFLPTTYAPIRDLPGIAAVNPVRLTFHHVRGRRIQLAAYDTRVDLTEARRAGRGRRVVAGPSTLDTNALFDAPRALISQNMANLLGLAPGDHVQLATGAGPRSFQVYAVVVDYSCDQGWMLIDRRWYESYWDDRRVDVVHLHFTPGVDHAALLGAIRARLGGAGSLFVTSHDGVREELARIARNVFAIARAPELIALLVAIMGVLGTTLAAVLDRVPEIGTMRAIGASGRQVVLTVVTESGFLGLSSALCGLLSGVAQGYIVLDVISRTTSGWPLPYYFPAAAALRTMAFVVIAAACAGVLPGRQAARLDTKRALSYE